MRVLVACEYSATVRDAFRARGHDAWSCDLLPTEGDPTWHIQDDVFHVLSSPLFSMGVDLFIGHPPCTYLANSGVKHLYRGGRLENGVDQDRWDKMIHAAEFFAALLAVNADRVALENPIMHRWAKAFGPIPQQDQTIQPWQHGHGETKATCLWLRKLPQLRPSNVVDGREQRVHRMPPSANRWKERSRTFRGIAEAMADQWGSL